MWRTSAFSPQQRRSTSMTSSPFSERTSHRRRLWRTGQAFKKTWWPLLEGAGQMLCWRSSDDLGLLDWKRLFWRMWMIRVHQPEYHSPLRPSTLMSTCGPQSLRNKAYQIRAPQQHWDIQISACDSDFCCSDIHLLTWDVCTVKALSYLRHQCKPLKTCMTCHYRQEWTGKANWHDEPWNFYELVHGSRSNNATQR